MRGRRHRSRRECRGAGGSSTGSGRWQTSLHAGGRPGTVGRGALSRSPPQSLIGSPLASRLCQLSLGRVRHVFVFEAVLAREVKGPGCRAKLGRISRSASSRGTIGDGRPSAGDVPWAMGFGVPGVVDLVGFGYPARPRLRRRVLLELVASAPRGAAAAVGRRGRGISGRAAGQTARPLGVVPLGALAEAQVTARDAGRLAGGDGDLRLGGRCPRRRRVGCVVRERTRAIVRRRGRGWPGWRDRGGGSVSGRRGEALLPGGRRLSLRALLVVLHGPVRRRRRRRLLSGGPLGSFDARALVLLGDAVKGQFQPLERRAVVCEHSWPVSRRLCRSPPRAPLQRLLGGRRPPHAAIGGGGVPAEGGIRVLSLGARDGGLVEGLRARRGGRAGVVVRLHVGAAGSLVGGGVCGWKPAARGRMPGARRRRGSARCVGGGGGRGAG